MKTVIKHILFFIIGVNSFAQKNYPDQFIFEGKSIKYDVSNFKKPSDSFLIIISDEVTSEKIKTNIKNCPANKKMGKTYMLSIPAGLKNKQELVLEFIADLLSKSKLIDRKMNILATNKDYLEKYKQQLKISPRYNKAFFNKINSLSIYNHPDDICKTLLKIK